MLSERKTWQLTKKQKSHGIRFLKKKLVLEGNGDTPPSPRGKVNFITEFYIELMY